MSKINLNFFGEKLTIEKPKNISDLRAQISQLFCFSPQDAQEILLTYNDNGDKVIIGNDEDLKAFLNSKIDTIDLDILEELINHGNELDKLKETKFASERKEIKELQAKINELSLKKCQIRKKILEGVKQIEKEKKENKKKIEDDNGTENSLKESINVNEVKNKRSKTEGNVDNNDVKTDFRDSIVSNTSAKKKVKKVIKKKKYV